METGLPGAIQVLVIRPVGEVHVREKESVPTHPPLEMESTAKAVIRNGSLATHSHVSTVTLEFKCQKKCKMYVYSGHALSYTKLVHRHATQTEGNKYFK